MEGLRFQQLEMGDRSASGLHQLVGRIILDEGGATEPGLSDLGAEPAQFFGGAETAAAAVVVPMLPSIHSRVQGVGHGRDPIMDMALSLYGVRKRLQTEGLPLLLCFGV